ncbi:MAG: D-2-hydroxyacid dehydrogenase [Rhodospirillaceae bacterium]
MPKTVAVYEKTIDRLRSRLEKFGPDVSFVPFNEKGEYIVDGRPSAPEEISIDYLWLSQDLSIDRKVGPALDMALKTKSIDVMQTFNAGLDLPAYKKIADKGVRICNSSAQAVAISEYVLANVLACFHPIARRQQLQSEKTWEKTPFREIAETNWLIVGYGPIGANVASRARAFGASVSVIRRSPQPIDGVDRVGSLDDMATYLSDADVIVLACALNDETRDMANARFFGAVKPGALLVNIARGGLIDEPALKAALDDGRISQAVLDVFNQEPLPADDPLWRHPGVIISAHTSFNGSGSRGRWDDLFFDSLPRFLKGESLLNEVAPEKI